MPSRSTPSRGAPRRPPTASDTDVAADRNVVVLSGRLSRPPDVRTLPSGDTIVSYEVTTRPDGVTALTVPVTYAADAAGVALDAGAAVVVTGVVRRRYFRAGGVTQSRTEVVATAIVPARQAAKARRAITQALATAGLPRDP